MVAESLEKLCHAVMQETKFVMNLDIWLRRLSGKMLSFVLFCCL